MSSGLPAHPWWSTFWVTSRSQALHISTERAWSQCRLNRVQGGGTQFRQKLTFFDQSQCGAPENGAPLQRFCSPSSSSHSSSAWSSFTTHNMNIEMDSKEITPTKTIKDTIRNKRCLSTLWRWGPSWSTTRTFYYEFDGAYVCLRVCFP